MNQIPEHLQVRAVSALPFHEVIKQLVMEYTVWKSEEHKES